MSPHPRIFFDLTTLAHFLARWPTPTGIQRVEMALLAGLLRRFGPDRLRGLLLDELRRETFDVDLRGVGGASEIAPDRLRDRLAVRTRRGATSEKLYRAALRRMPPGPRRWAAPRPNWFAPLALAPNDVVLLPGLNLRIDAFYAALATAGRSDARVVQLVHDVIALKLPELCDMGVVERSARYFDAAIAGADELVCVSASTARDLGDAMALRGVEKTTTVAPLAHQFGDVPRGGPSTPAPATLRAAVASLAARADFALCVGTFEPRKNGGALLQAWRALGALLDAPPPTLVFAGRFGWKTDAFRAELADLRSIGADIALVETPTDAELAALYAAAMFTVFPSLYEGWGLPVGESLWFGTPCLATQVSAVPEVGGDLCDYFDPTDPMGLAGLIAEKLTTPGALAEDAARIRAATLRSWDDAAGDLAAVLERVASRP